MRPLRTEYDSSGEDETIAFAEKLADELESGSILILRGPLGAGKTVFVRGLAQGLGCTDKVSSPSFVTENLYRGPVSLLHIDLYRGFFAPTDLSIEDVRLAGGIVAVEWGEKLPRRLVDESIHIDIEIPDEISRPTHRRIGVTGIGAES